MGEAARVIVRAGLVRETGWQSADLLIGEAKLRLDAAAKVLQLLTDDDGVVRIWAEGWEPESTLDGYTDAVVRLGLRFHRADKKS